jgi:signal transduction histidine kinase
VPENRDLDIQAVAVYDDTVSDTVDLIKKVETLRAERDALRQRVESSAADLDSLLQARNEFIAAASHDLKSPLTAILGSAQYMERLLAAPILDADKLVGWARVIQDQVRIMTLLINDLIDASRVHAGAFDLRVAPCEMTLCVATVTGRLVPALQARVHLTVAPQPIRGHWDRRRIEQVLSNLLDNALKYSPNGERVTLVVEKRAEEVEVVVKDRGVGISPGELPRLFERFYRAADATGGAVAGTGLGLYICERIITAHGGRLWAESAGWGKGSSFRFILPIRPPADSKAARPESQAR